jgi:transposase-like protein
METTIKPVQNGRGRKRRWPVEQKLAVLQKWKTGVPLKKVCRKYAVNAAQMYRWKRSLDQGLKEFGELVPKSQALGLQKRVEELERAWGGRPWRWIFLKKCTSSRGSDYPRGRKMAGASHRMFRGVRVSGVRQATELAPLPAADSAWTVDAATGRGGGDHPAPRGQPRS